MKIGFDVSQTGKGKAGCGYVADAMIQALVEKDRRTMYMLYPFFGSDYHDPDALASTRRIDQPNVRTVAVAKRVGDAMDFWQNFPDGGEDRLGGPDIIHANNFYCPTFIRRARIVYTLHDVCFLEHPEFTTEANRRICFNGVFNAALYADVILAVSESTRLRFLHFFPHFPGNRILVIRLASRFSVSGKGQSPTPLLPRNLKHGSFWLSVGTLEPRKNIRGLLSAYAQFRKESGNPFPLVLAGGDGWLEGDLPSYIEELGISESVQILGYVSDVELKQLYQSCFAFLYPSFYEGFGLPVLEAMSLGAPVITSDRTSLPEVAGDAALYVDPLDPESISMALFQLSRNEELRRSLSTRGCKRAERFTWERTAEAVFDAYRMVLELPKLGKAQN